MDRGFGRRACLLCGRGAADSSRRAADRLWTSVLGRWPRFVVQRAGQRTRSGSLDSGLSGVVSEGASGRHADGSLSALAGWARTWARATRAAMQECAGVNKALQQTVDVEGGTCTQALCECRRPRRAGFHILIYRAAVVGKGANSPAPPPIPGVLRGCDRGAHTAPPPPHSTTAATRVSACALGLRWDCLQDVAADGCPLRVLEASLANKLEVLRNSLQALVLDRLSQHLANADESRGALTAHDNYLLV